MKVEVTLSREEHASLRTLPAGSDQQRIRLLIRMWEATARQQKPQPPPVAKWQPTEIDTTTTDPATAIEMMRMKVAP